MYFCDINLIVKKRKLMELLIVHSELFLFEDQQNSLAHDYFSSGTFSMPEIFPLQSDLKEIKWKKKKDFLLLLFFCFLQTKIVISGMNFARSSRVAIFFAWGQLHAVKGCLGSTKRWYLLGVVLFCLGKNILIPFLIGCRFWIFMGLYKTINKFTVRI